MGLQVPCSAPEGMRHLRERGRGLAGQVLPAALPWDLGTCTKLLMPGMEMTSAPSNMLQASVFMETWF